MAKTVFDVLIDTYTEEKNSVVDALSSGAATDYAEYREMVGRIRGLRSAIKDTADLARNHMELDDE